jgi:hypothetical protein
MPPNHSPIQRAKIIIQNVISNLLHADSELLATPPGHGQIVIVLIMSNFRNWTFQYFQNL